MSNITLFQNGGSLSTRRRHDLSETTRALMGGGVGKRISIEGGVWRLIVGGQEVAVNEDRAMNVIILRAAPHNSRTFYEGKYVKGTKSVPSCWSNDGTTPDASVKNPQSDKCATCPQNIKGSGDRAESRACRYSRKLAVLLENDVDGDVYAMSVPAASIFGQGEGRKMGLQQYARFLGGHGADVNDVVTEMRFDTQAEGVKLVFSAVREISDAEFEVVNRRKDEQGTIDAVTMTVAQIDGDQPVAAPTSAPKPAAPAPAPKPAAPAAKSAGFTVSKAKPAEKEPEPVVRESKPAAPAVTDVDSVLAQWGDDTDD